MMKTNAPPPKKKKPDELWIHEIPNDLCTIKVLCDSNCYLPVSGTVKCVAATKPAPSWLFYCKLATPILEKVGTTKWVFEMRMLPVSKTKKYSHVCTEEMKDVNRRPVKVAYNFK